MNWNDFALLLPVGVVMGSALVVVFLDLVLEAKDRYILPLAAVAGCALAFSVLLQNYLALTAARQALPWFAGWAAPGPEASHVLILNGSLAMDGFGMAISAVALLAGALSILCSSMEEQDSALSSGEYYGLLLLAVCGTMLLGHAHDFLTLLVSLEIMSVSTYILAGSRRGDARSGESALKYLVLGAFSTAFLMMGMAFIYGATGSLSLSAVGPDVPEPWVLGGLGLMLVGLLFKTGAAPFHFWVPDVYEGAPTGVTAFMAAGVKAGAFALAARLIFETFGSLNSDIHAGSVALLAAAAVATMVLGNFLAIQQRSLKRMLAYSGMAHSGYLLLAFLIRPDPSAALVEEHLRAVIFYLITYGVMVLGALGVVSLAREDGQPLEDMDDLTGLARTHPAIALCMAVFMLSLAGMPPFGGFFAKFLIFRGAVEEGYVSVAVLGVLTSVASLYYYLRVVVKMYMTAPPEEEPDGGGWRYAWTLNLLIYGAGAVTLALGLFPGWLIRL